MTTVELQEQPVSQIVQEQENVDNVENLISAPLDVNNEENDQENVEPVSRNSVPFKEQSQNKQVENNNSSQTVREGLKDVTNECGLREEMKIQQETTKKQIDQLLKEVKEDSEKYNNNVENQQQKNSQIVIEDHQEKSQEKIQEKKEKQEVEEEEDKENKSSSTNKVKQQQYSNKHQENIHKFYQTLIQKDNAKKQQPQQLKPIPSKITAQSNINDILNVSLNKLNFGLVVPGNIFEETLTITNKLNETMILEVLVLCLNKELDDHDEYVYSVRKTTGYDYNERYLIKINPFEEAVFKIALKVPNLSQATEILGQTVISVQNVQQKYTFDIQSKLELPKVMCNKALYNPTYQTQVIKLAIKKGKKLDSKIPFKNVFNGTLNFEFEWLDTRDIQDCNNEVFSVSLHPGSLNVQSNNIFIVNVILKPKEGYSAMDDPNPINMRKVLLVKVKNSSVILSFPVEITVY